MFVSPHFLGCGSVLSLLDLPEASILTISSVTPSYLPFRVLRCHRMEGRLVDWSPIHNHADFSCQHQNCVLHEFPSSRGCCRWFGAGDGPPFLRNPVEGIPGEARCVSQCPRQTRNDLHAPGGDVFRPCGRFSNAPFVSIPFFLRRFPRTLPISKSPMIILSLKAF
jgi:hypothetical protein